MPVYEFKCRQCHQVFEELVVSTDEKIACPSCGGADVQKQISLIASGQTSPPSGQASSCGSRGKFT